MSRGDSPMNCRWAWMLPVLSIVTMLLSDTAAQAQGPMPPGPGGPPPGMMGPGMGPGPGMYDPDSMGGMGMMGPGDGMACPPGMDDGMGGMGGPGGGHFRNGLLGDILGIVAPYADGGCAAPRWFDYEIGVMVLNRENAGRNTNFASDGVGGPIVLSIDDLDFDYSTSVKFTAMMQWGPGSNLEFTYYGLFGWTEFAQVQSADNLYSIYSDFGTNPGPNGFPETDAASFSSIRYFSTFDNYEVNFRQRWQSPNCRYQGSWLYGVRYFQLDEDFNYRIETDTGGPVGPDTFTRTNVNVNNALTGLQIGGDVWICLIPGLRIGGEGKFAVLGNHANIDSSITVRDGAGVTTFADGSVVGDVAFLGDLAAYVTYRINYHWTFKAGFQALYLDGAALASENFNPAPPNIFFPGPVPARQPVRSENGDVFWHGYTMSMEYLW
jgi:hypothetical protein